MPGDHSIIAPSAADIWGAPNGCTAFPTLSAQYPEEETEEAREGTAAHEIGESLIGFAARGQQPPWGEYDGGQARNGVLFTHDMYAAARVWSDDVQAVMRQTGVFTPRVEARIHAPQVHDQSWGTCDTWLFDTSQGVLYVWDFKYGMRYVPARGSRQLVNYVAGILRELGVPDEHVRVVMRVVQPRCFHSRGPIGEWSVVASDLRPYINQLHGGAHEALGLNPVARSGSHCRDCPARHECEAALTGGVQLYEAATAPVTTTLTDRALGAQLAIVTRAREQLEYLESAYREQAEMAAKSGRHVPGWRTEPKMSREQWAMEPASVIRIGEMLGHDLRNPKPITPNQARQKGMDPDLVNSYTEKRQTGITLVPDDGTKATEVFSHDS